MTTIHTNSNNANGAAPHVTVEQAEAETARLKSETAAGWEKVKIEKLMLEIAKERSAWEDEREAVEEARRAKEDVRQDARTEKTEDRADAREVRQIKAALEAEGLKDANKEAKASAFLKFFAALLEVVFGTISKLVEVLNRLQEAAEGRALRRELALLSEHPEYATARAAAAEAAQARSDIRAEKIETVFWNIVAASVAAWDRVLENFAMAIAKVIEKAQSPRDLFFWVGSQKSK